MFPCDDRQNSAQNTDDNKDNANLKVQQQKHEHKTGDQFSKFKEGAIDAGHALSLAWFDGTIERNAAYAVQTRGTHSCKQKTHNGRPR